MAKVHGQLRQSGRNGHYNSMDWRSAIPVGHSLGSGKLIAQVYFFTPDAQFVTTVIGSDTADSRGTLTRKRWPLPAT